MDRSRDFPTVSLFVILPPWAR